MPTLVKVQLVTFLAVAVTAVTVLTVGYMNVPAMIGIGRYTVTVQLAESGGLYESSNVTYRGTEVGRVEKIEVAQTGLTAYLSLHTDIAIPADVHAEVHSQSAIGEQYVALVPRGHTSAVLADGAVIEPDRTSIPPDINDLLDRTNTGLLAIPDDNLKILIDETYTGIGGLGPELARIVDGGIRLAADAGNNRAEIANLIESAQPLLQTQIDSADSVTGWTGNLASITRQLKEQDESVRAILRNAAPAAAEAQTLIDTLKPTLPVLLANLLSVGQVAITYQPNIEQLLVLLPQSIASFQAAGVPGIGTSHPGVYTTFNLGVNLPPPCATGYLPADQRRSPVFEDYPERPPGDLYCRIPQDSRFVVRGARNIPCANNPRKRAPTVAICESDQEYVPLNDGLNWKGDPNATLSGQDVPQLPPGSPPQVPPPVLGPTGPALTFSEYDPVTGNYLGPDGQTYTQSNLAQNAHEGDWRTLLVPPGA